MRKSGEPSVEGTGKKHDRIDSLHKISSFFLSLRFFSGFVNGSGICSCFFLLRVQYFFFLLFFFCCCSGWMFSLRNMGHFECSMRVNSPSYTNIMRAHTFCSSFLYPFTIMMTEYSRVFLNLFNKHFLSIIFMSDIGPEVRL